MSAPVLLAIAGSPRRSGNSDRLLAACLDAAETAGVRAERIIAADLAIGPCRGCNACSKTGACIQRDAMTQVYRSIDTADGILVASPVFFAGVPAQLKALIDRLQPYWARRFVLGESLVRRRPGGIVLVRGGGDPYGAGCAEGTLRSAYAVLGIDVVDALVVEGVDAPADVEARRDAFAQAALLGEQLAVAISAVSERS